MPFRSGLSTFASRRGGWVRLRQAPGWSVWAPRVSGAFPRRTEVHRAVAPPWPGASAVRRSSHRSAWSGSGSPWRPPSVRLRSVRYRPASAGHHWVALGRFSCSGCPAQVTSSLHRSVAPWPVRSAPPGSPSASSFRTRLPLCRGCLSRCLVDHWPRVNSSCGRFPSGAVPPPRRMDRSRSRSSPLSRCRPLASAGFAFFPPSVAARGLLRTVG